jgi:predicted aspartyl protease
LGDSDRASHGVSSWFAKPEKVNMMQGWVNQNCEAMLPIIVGHGNAPKQMVEALIDTGFSGLLSLPSSMIKLLGLPWIFSDSVRLGDGS